VKFEYDEDRDAVYISLEHPIKKGQVKKTIELNDRIILDFDEEERLVHKFSSANMIWLMLKLNGF